MIMHVSGPWKVLMTSQILTPTRSDTNEEKKRWMWITSWLRLMNLRVIIVSKSLVFDFFLFLSFFSLVILVKVITQVFKRKKRIWFNLLKLIL